MGPFIPIHLEDIISIFLHRSTIASSLGEMIAEKISGPQETWLWFESLTHRA